MRIAVIGAGSIGSLYGANLCRIGESVVLIDLWREHIEAIRKDGLRMRGLHGTFTAHPDATVDPDAVKDVDLAIITVNTYATWAAANTAKAILGPGGHVLTLQNGLGNVETLQEILGSERVLAGLTFHSADVLGPGQVDHTNEGPTYLGELDRSRTSRLAIIEELMERAGMKPLLPDDMRVLLWSKFVHNCGINALCAITGLRPNEIAQVPALDELQTQIIEEALALVRAKNIRLPDDDPVSTIKAYCAKKGHRVSMAQHLARGRQTEIDALNGYVVRESRKLGLAAPYNDALMKIAKGREHKQA